MKIGSLATRNLVLVDAADSLDKAISLMEEHAVHHLPVVNRGVVCGMLSDRDVLLGCGWRLSRERHTLGGAGTLAGPRIVGEIMSAPIITMPPDCTVAAVARIMTQRRISAVVLANSEGLAGIVTKLDLLSRARDLAGVDTQLFMLRETVEKHMRVRVCTVSPRHSLQDLAALLHDKGLRHVPVVVDGGLVGIVSDRDFRRECGVGRIEDQMAMDEGRFHSTPTAVTTIMSRRVRTIDPQATVLDAAERMSGHRIGALPVTREGKLVGIISETDVVRIMGYTED